MQTYHKLLKLEGRLDLALSQVASHKAGASYMQEPELVIQEVPHAHADLVIGAEDDEGEDDEDDEDDEEDEDEDGEDEEEEEGESDDDDMEDD